MAQRFLGGDTIGSLSQNAGTITLAASRLTIGGQQYKTSALTVTPSLAANRMYCLYVVLSAGIPTLVSSLNLNSVGPAGFTSWKLVGAFVSKYNSTFGDFLSIEGLPIIKVWTSGSSNSPNINVAASLDINGATSDPFGCITPNSGSFSATTGLWSVQNARITNPIPGATAKLVGVIGWVPQAVNVTNNWDVLVNKNGGLVMSNTINSWGANQTNLAYLKLPWMVQVTGNAATDYFEIYGRNNHGTHPTNLHQAEIEFIGVKQIKDM